MIISFYDCIGDEMREGDTIGVSFEHCKSSYIRIGNIVSFGKSVQGAPCGSEGIEVEWTGGWLRPKSAVTVIHYDPKRIIKIK